MPLPWLWQRTVCWGAARAHGVLSGPRGGKARRAAIRDSWMRYSDVGVRLTVCFVLGERGLSRRARRSLDAPDVIWMDVEETGILSIPKCFEWWRTASRTASQFSHIAKVDDDTFVHVPKFMHALGEAVHKCPSRSSLARWRTLGTGHIRSACVAGPGRRAAGRGISSNAVSVASRRSSRSLSARCKCCRAAWRTTLARGVPSIALWPLPTRAATCASARATRTSRSVTGSLSTLPGQRANVSYVMINDRAPNLGCFRDGGLYRRPRAEHIVIHRVKGAEGMTYVWRQLHDGASHDPLTCARDASIELPRNSFLFQPAFASRVRNGSVELTFNQKTNKVSIVFKPRPLKDVIKK